MLCSSHQPPTPISALFPLFAVTVTSSFLPGCADATDTAVASDHPLATVPTVDDCTALHPLLRAGRLEACTRYTGANGFEFASSPGTIRTPPMSRSACGSRRSCRT